MVLAAICRFALCAIEAKRGRQNYNYPFRKPRDIDACDLKGQWWKNMLVDLTIHCLVMTYSFHIALLG